MEVLHDWTKYQNVFYPHHRKKAFLGGQGLKARMGVIIRGDVIIRAYSGQEDLQQWSGAQLSDFCKHFAHYEIHAFDVAKVDENLTKVAEKDHFVAQEQLLDNETEGTLLSFDESSECIERTTLSARELSNKSFQNFLVQGVTGWWKKLLPQSYGIYLKMEGARHQDFFLLVRDGGVERYFVPDFTGLGGVEHRIPGELVRSLSERYAVPVQGIFVQREDWMVWTESNHPWPGIAKAIRTKRAQLIPFRWGLVSLVALRAFLSI